MSGPEPVHGEPPPVSHTAGHAQAVELQWNSVAGRTYVIEASTSAKVDSWEALGLNPFEAEGPTSLISFDAPPADLPAVFYRVRRVGD